MKINKNKVITFLLLLLFTVNTNAQESNLELAKAAQNPIANMMSFPFMNSTTFGMGTYDRTQNVLNVQPVLPFFNGRLITRTILPVITQPDLGAESGSTTGIGDITFTAFYSPPSNKLTWGIGPVVNIPTAGDGLGAHEWGFGPSVIVLKLTPKWVYGFLTSNIWSAGGAENEINSFLFQYFLNYNLKNGYYISSAPIITANWLAEEGNQWTVPFGIGGGKIVKLGGKLPVNLQAQGFYNVVRPDNGGAWTLRLLAVVLLPTSIFKK